MDIPEKTRAAVIHHLTRAHERFMESLEEGEGSFAKSLASLGETRLAMLALFMPELLEEELDALRKKSG